MSSLTIASDYNKKNTYHYKYFYIEFIKDIKIENENLTKKLELPINLKNNIINEEIIKVSKKKTSKPNIIINDDSNETKEKKVINKIRIKKKQ